MSKVNKYKFTVEKHGRKWTKIVIHYNSGRDGKAKVLKEKVADIHEGETVIRDGKLYVQINGYGKNVELIVLADDEVAGEKEAERKKFIDDWWGYFLDSYEKGRFYGKAVEVLHEAGYHEKDQEIKEMRRTLCIDKWWGYFLDSYEQGWIYDRAILELHKLDYHDKDEEIKKCNEEIERKKQEKRQLQETQYQSFSFEATGGFRGKPQKGDLFVRNDIPYEVVSSYYHNCDGFSFGLMSEDWYAVKAKDISDTARGREFLERLLESRKLNELRANTAKKKELAYKALVDEIEEAGQRYVGETVSLSDIEGNDIVDTFNVYGGGYIVRVADDKVWLIINHGMDGDAWDVNNIETGGAGAYGYFVEYERIKDKIKDYLKAAQDAQEFEA